MCQTAYVLVLICTVCNTVATAAADPVTAALCNNNELWFFNNKQLYFNSKQLKQGLQSLRQQIEMPLESNIVLHEQRLCKNKP
jgi:hypothetical protein